MSGDLPGGISRRQFLEDVLDVMSDAQIIVRVGRQLVEWWR